MVCYIWSFRPPYIAIRGVERHFVEQKGVEARTTDRVKLLAPLSFFLSNNNALAGQWCNKNNKIWH